MIFLEISARFCHFPPQSSSLFLPQAKIMWNFPWKIICWREFHFEKSFLLPSQRHLQIYILRVFHVNHCRERFWLGNWKRMIFWKLWMNSWFSFILKIPHKFLFTSIWFHPNGCALRQAFINHANSFKRKANSVRKNYVVWLLKFSFHVLKFVLKSRHFA